jgi:sphingomyelin phosphodiesterase
MKKLALALCALLLDLTQPVRAAYPDDLKITTWNTMLLPLAAFPNYGQLARSRQIAESPVLQNQDVVVFQEMFDNEASNALLSRAKHVFPFQTPVIGRTKTDWSSTEGQWRDTIPVNGGVAIISKWPIVEKVQYLYYTMGCGDDLPSLKGFAYARINVGGEFYHVLGTHLQSESSWGCGGSAGHAAVRLAQLREIRDWIRARNIPANEMVLIAGDLNISRYNAAEYEALLRMLDVAEPHFVGVPYSFDTAGNGVALERYGARSGDPESYLDYILVEKNHRQPSFWHNLAVDPPSEQWTVQDALTKRTYAYTDYSDHYPVMGFANADASTPTKSFVDPRGSYREISLQNISNGKWVQGSDANDGWLKTDADSPITAARFNLSNNFSMRDNGCVRSGEYVRIERADRSGWFWTWWGVPGSTQYAYYTARGALNADPELRLVNLSSPSGECLRDGDTVALKDWARAADYYVTSWNDRRYNDWLFLWRSSIGPTEQFRVRVQNAPRSREWGSQLRYGTNVVHSTL